MRGILYGVGVGPGDPELMTVKAVRVLRESDVVILPAEPKEDCYAYKIAKTVVPEVEEKEIVCLPFLMIKDKEELERSHQAIYDRIAAFLEEGKNVAFLTIGDPAVYSTYNYIHEKEKKNGGTPVMISGVPSFCAAAAAVGISLGDKKEQIHIIPGSYETEETMQLSGTRIYMKSGRSLGQLKKLLLSHTEKKVDVYSISNCGMENEKIVYGAEQIDENSNYLTLVIVKEGKE